MVLMLTFRMLRIFNSLAFILVSYYEGLVESYKDRMHKNQVLIVKSNERRRHLAEKAMALLDEKRQLQIKFTLTSRRISDASSAGSSSSGLKQQFADGEEDLIVEELNRARMDLHDNKQRRLTISNLDNDDYVSPRASQLLRANANPQMGRINQLENTNAAVISPQTQNGTTSHSEITPVLKRKNQQGGTATPPSRRAKSRNGSLFHARMSNLYDNRFSIMERPSQERSSREPSLAQTPRNSQNPFFIK
ncbi:unnamed protein product [Oikopleura dioica]|uniref:Uncharacterized protein n=1 Tax=Oikopleura dioica TaxID=34765 RepID=E4YDW4_OIKDI|nr:unnamed protein product [Oikopleura dioica]